MAISINSNGLDTAISSLNATQKQLNEILKALNNNTKTFNKAIKQSEAMFSNIAKHSTLMNKNITSSSKGLLSTTAQMKRFLPGLGALAGVAFGAFGAITGYTGSVAKKQIQESKFKENYGLGLGYKQEKAYGYLNSNSKYAGISKIINADKNRSMISSLRNTPEQSYKSALSGAGISSDIYNTLTKQDPDEAYFTLLNEFMKANKGSSPYLLQSRLQYLKDELGVDISSNDFAELGKGSNFRDAVSQYQRYRDNTYAVDGGVLDKYSASMTGLEQALDNLGSKLSDSFLPKIADLIDVITNAINGYMNRNKHNDIGNDFLGKAAAVATGVIGARYGYKKLKLNAQARSLIGTEIPSNVVYDRINKHTPGYMMRQGTSLTADKDKLVRLNNKQAVFSFIPKSKIEDSMVSKLDILNEARGGKGTPIGKSMLKGIKAASKGVPGLGTALALWDFASPDEETRKSFDQLSQTLDSRTMANVVDAVATFADQFSEMGEFAVNLLGGPFGFQVDWNLRKYMLDKANDYFQPKTVIMNNDASLQNTSNVQ